MRTALSTSLIAVLPLISGCITIQVPEFKPPDPPKLPDLPELTPSETPSDDPEGIPTQKPDERPSDEPQASEAMPLWYDARLWGAIGAMIAAVGSIWADNRKNEV